MSIADSRSRPRLPNSRFASHFPCRPASARSRRSASVVSCCHSCPIRLVPLVSHVRRRRRFQPCPASVHIAAEPAFPSATSNLRLGASAPRPPALASAQPGPCSLLRHPDPDPRIPRFDTTGPRRIDGGNPWSWRNQSMPPQEPAHASAGTSPHLGGARTRPAIVRTSAARAVQPTGATLGLDRISPRTPAQQVPAPAPRGRVPPRH